MREIPENFTALSSHLLLLPFVLAPVMVATYLVPPPLDVLTIEPVRNIAHVVEVDRLVVEYAI